MEIGRTAIRQQFLPRSGHCLPKWVEIIDTQSLTAAIWMQGPRRAGECNQLRENRGTNLFVVDDVKARRNEKRKCGFIFHTRNHRTLVCRRRCCCSSSSSSEEERGVYGKWYQVFSSRLGCLPASYPVTYTHNATRELNKITTLNMNVHTQRGTHFYLKTLDNMHTLE